MKQGAGSLSAAPTRTPRGAWRLREFGTPDLKRRLARWNHILIPDKKLDRDRLRRRRWVKLLGVGLVASQALTREGRALFLLLVPVGLAALDVRGSEVHLLWAGLVGLLLSAWLIRPLFKVGALHASVQNAQRVAVDEELRFEVKLANRGRTPLFNIRVLPPFLPWDGRWTAQPSTIAELGPGERAGVTARARFQARGEHHLDTFDAGQLVLGGLAIGPTTPTPGARFLVVPRVARVEQLTVGAARADGHGAIASSVQPGETDISGVRPYRVGDELKHLHARTWARTGVPHVRQYVAERQDAVILAVLCGAPEIGERVKEATLSLGAGVAAHLAFSRGGLDALVCEDKSSPIVPRAGAAALDRVLDQLAVVELSTRRPSLATLDQALARASCVVVVAAEDTRELRTLLERAQLRGVRCTAAIVVEHPPPPSDSWLRYVHAAVIEQGKGIRL